LVVTTSSIEVVVGNSGDIEGIGGLKGNSSGIVAGMGLENSPSKPVMFMSGVDRVPGEVSTEVDRATEDEDVELIASSNRALVEHGSTETWRSVDPTVTQDRLLPAGKTWVTRFTTLSKSATVQSREVRWGLSLNVDLVVVLKVRSDTWQISDDRDVESLELIGRSDTRQLQKLRAVVGATCDDDLARSLHGAGGSSSAPALRAGLVKVLAIEELDSSSTRRCDGLVESNLGNMTVQSYIQRETLSTISVDRIANSEDELAGAGALAISSRQGNLIDRGLCVTGGGISVCVSGKKARQIDHGVCLVSEGESGTSDQAEKLWVSKHNVDGGVLSSKPSIITVALLARKKIMIVFQLGKVLPHISSRPGLVTSQAGDEVEIALMGVDGDQSVVRSAASKGSSTWVQGTKLLGTSRWAQSSVATTIRCLVGSLVVAGLSLLIGIVLHEKVP